jgi:peptide/nickel transport system ATP-binding protein
MVEQPEALSTSIASVKPRAPVLEVRELSVVYKIRGGEVPAIRNVSFEITRGEAFGLVGESGCGKSTTAWAIVDFLGPNGAVRHGSVKFQGQELLGKSTEELRKLRGNRIAMVYQDPLQSLNPSLRIGEQMKEALTVHQRLGDKAAVKRCVEMLDRVYMPDPVSVLDRYPHQISGGQQQRIVIAMALLNDPALLIMDEPTTALDVTVEAAVLDLIDELRRDFDTAILFITHNLGVIARICDRVGVMYAGELVELASVDNLINDPQHPYTQGLIRCPPRVGAGKAESVLYPIRGQVPPPGKRPPGCVFEPRCDYARDRCRSERPELRPLPNGAYVRCHFAEEIDPALWIPPSELHPVQAPACSNDPTNPLILDVHDLQKYYPIQGQTLKDILGLGERRYVQALECASFALSPGQTLGVVGESGCGKSTLVRTIIGLESSTAGTAEFMGFDISGGLSERDSALIREMQMVFQNPDSTMNPSYPVGQQIARPIERFGTAPKDQIRAEVIRLLEAVRLGEHYYDRFPRQLSGGEKQRVGIARALASRPDLILCDEPISALDVSVQAALLNLLTELQREYGMAMIFIAHDLTAVRHISDQIAVMYLGEIVEIGPAEAIYAPPYHPYTEALLSAVPVLDPSAHRSRIRLEGVIPSAIDPPRGCRFHTRCPRRSILPDGGAICEVQEPPWQLGAEDHRILCHIPIDILRALDPAIMP